MPIRDQDQPCVAVTEATFTRYLHQLVHLIGLGRQIVPLSQVGIGRAPFPVRRVVTAGRFGISATAVVRPMIGRIGCEGGLENFRGHKNDWDKAPAGAGLRGSASVRRPVVAVYCGATILPVLEYIARRLSILVNFRIYTRRSADAVDLRAGKPNSFRVLASSCQYSPHAVNRSLR